MSAAIFPACSSSSLGLLLGTEAPVMTPKGTDFSLCFLSSSACWLSLHTAGQASSSQKLVLAPQDQTLSVCEQMQSKQQRFNRLAEWMS